MGIARDLTGQLLVATPQIGDGVFYRSVVLLLHHDEDGAQGIILNRTIDAPVDAVLPGWGGLTMAPGQVYQGGPVQLDSVLGVALLAGWDEQIPGVRRMFGEVGLVDLERDPSTLAEEVRALRIYAGYAGWSGLQLEEEVATGSWFVVDRRPGDIAAPDPSGLWSAVLARQRGSLALVASFPDDPTQN